MPRDQGRRVALPGHGRAAMAPLSEGKARGSPAGRAWGPLGRAEPPDDLRVAGNVLVRESCLKLHFHHCVMEGNNREMMGPFPSGIWLIGFV